LFFNLNVLFLLLDFIDSINDEILAAGFELRVLFAGLFFFCDILRDRFVFRFHLKGFACVAVYEDGVIRRPDGQGSVLGNQEILPRTEHLNRFFNYLLSVVTLFLARIYRIIHVGVRIRLFF
jgi:hypothetical protein